MFATVFIPGVLKEYVIKHFSEAKARKLNKYLEGYNAKYSVRTALIYAIDTMKITLHGKGYHLEVDKSRVIPGTSFNIETIVKVITYGTVDIKGYDILLKSFDYISRKLNTLKKIYAAENKKKGE